MVTDGQCVQSVEDHRVAIAEWGLMLLHTLGPDWSEFDWYSGPGFDRYMEVQRAKRAGKTYR